MTDMSFSSSTAPNGAVSVAGTLPGSVPGSARKQQRGRFQVSGMPFDSPLAARTRPSSEIFLQTPLAQFGSSVTLPNTSHGLSDGTFLDAATEKWMADLELYQRTLEEMAEVGLDKNFKDELSDIEKWFQVLSVGERTTALYALLQHTTPVQNRFFVTVLQRFASQGQEPVPSVLSPTAADREMFLRQQQQQQQQQQYQSPQPGQAPGTAGPKHKLHQPQPQGIPSAFAGLHSHTPFTPSPKHDLYSNSLLGFSKGMAPPVSPWAQEISRPKSADAPLFSTSAQSHAHSSSLTGIGSGLGGLPSAQKPGVPPFKTHNAHNKSMSVLDDSAGSYHLDESFTSYLPDSNANWASIVNTPVSQRGGSTPQGKINAEIANSTAMKLAALSTVNNRVVLDSDVKKYRRRGSFVSSEDQQYIEREIGNLHLQAQAATTASSSAIGQGQQWALASPIGSPTMAAPKGQSPQERKSGLSKVSYGMESPMRDGPGSPIPGSTTPPKKDNYLDPELLQDIGAWLRSLRLHKYTENLIGLDWKDLINLTDEDLEARGVNALGARRKMLKVFEQVKEQQNA